MPQRRSPNSTRATSSCAWTPRIPKPKRAPRSTRSPRAWPAAPISRRWPSPIPKTKAPRPPAATWAGSRPTSSARRSARRWLRSPTARCPSRSAAMRAGTSCNASARARARRTRAARRRCAKRSAAASSKTNTTASCAKCAARPTSKCAWPARRRGRPPTAAEMSPPRLALVPGEPAGIGPELCVRLAQQPRRDASLVAFGDGDTLAAAARALSLPLRLLPADAVGTHPGDLPLQPIPNAVPVEFGQADPRNARAVVGALETAARACLDGACDGLVTGPVHKATINDGGIAYTGTTELLARQAQCDVVMMLANDIVRVALATTHLPLRAVPDAIDAASLARTLRIVDAALRTRFGIDAPRIAVLGLNPHAGEDGHLGREELDVIAPVIAALRAEGLQLTGPLPADTAFLPAHLRDVDAVLAMYHDQGLPVLKYSGFEHAVNLTLGLPYPRVAVDHGTALALAGRGLADPSSLIAAAHTCARIAALRSRRAAPP